MGNAIKFFITKHANRARTNSHLLLTTCSNSNKNIRNKRKGVLRTEFLCGTPACHGMERPQVRIDTLA